MQFPWKRNACPLSDHDLPKSPYLIVGLGNPGDVYRFTRHNIGFMAIDRMSEKYRLKSHPDSRVAAELTRGSIADKSVLTVKPMAFMNLSGFPVATVCRWYEIQCKDIIIIHDDIDLAYGRLKIKEKGGDGGHNGLRSLMDALGTAAFTRVRMGVGRPPAGKSVVDYVLGEFDEEQQGRLDEFLACAVEAVDVILCDGAKEAMNRFNRKT